MEVVPFIQKFLSLPVLNRHHNGKVNVFVSIIPRNKGGGSNTFAYNFKKWLLKNSNKYNWIYNINKSDKAVIIADRIDVKKIIMAKDKGCFIIHRIDEHVVENENEFFRLKHASIKRINSFADATVYQSRFVFENMHSFLDYPQKYEIIHNGADPAEFFPTEKSGEYIGHVTWGVGDKKRLDILYDTIKKHREERFLLVGNHFKSKYPFRSLPNVTYSGPVNRKRLQILLRQMKFLFFPSENDPCPNTVIESILTGVPVCFHPIGGTKELVKDCGLPISEWKTMIKDYSFFRDKCLLRTDLHFDTVFKKYMDL